MSDIQATFNLHSKQREAFNHLRDPKVLTVLFGGAISGGKSQLIAAWILWSALTFPDTRWLIGRKVLKDLINSTVVSLFRVAREMNIEDILDKGYNRQRQIIELPNRSTIILRQLDPSPGDTTFQELGSIELTGAAVDECGQVDALVQKTLIQRLRWNLPPHGGKILLCSNPSKGWCFDIFDQWEKKILPPSVKYIHCTPFDNPFNEPSYLATLTRENINDEAVYQSQILGNWRYESGDEDLFSVTDIHNAFTWSDEGVDQKERFLTWDPAYGGKDRSVVMLWKGMILERCWVWRKVDASQQVADVKRIIAEHHIPSRNVSIDGIGSAALVSQFRGCVDHRANAKPLNGEAFTYLKDQLYFRLAEAIKRGVMRFHAPEIREELTAELLAHKSYRNNTDQNARVLPKDQITRTLGRSPDLSDTVMQRMYFALRRRELVVDVVRW